MMSGDAVSSAVDSGGQSRAYLSLSAQGELTLKKSTLPDNEQTSSRQTSHEYVCAGAVGSRMDSDAALEVARLREDERKPDMSSS